MSEAAVRIPFERALDLNLEHDGEYTTNFPSAFVFGSRAHGGLLVSLIQRAATLHFESASERPDQPHVLDLKIHFLNPTFAREIKIFIRDISIRKQASTIEASVYQAGKLNIIGLVTMGNLGLMSGISFDTRWSLFPAPDEACLSKLATDSDSRWISYQCLWHPQGWLRPQSYVKFFVPLQLSDPSYRDSWITPSNPSFTFRNEHLGYVGDMTLPILDNFCGDKGMGGQKANIAVGLAQQRDRERGTVKVADAISASFLTPITSATLSLNMEVKKKLPPEGVRWLFSRSRAKQIKDGRMDNEIVILDEHGELVALCHQVHQVIDLTRTQSSKAKI